MTNYDLKHNLSSTQLNQFKIFFETLVEENKKYNLTSIIEEEKVYEKHFYDSLSLSDLIDDNSTVVDVGTGGGMPGLPIKIANPSLKLTFLDSNKKKMEFLKLISNKLEIDNNYIYGRAEEINEQFDYVVARGVASLNILLELCCNLVKLDGKIIAMKGSNYQEELNNSKNVIEKLGYELENIKEYVLPNEQSHHFNLVFKKVKEHNNKYPRNYAQIKKNPL